MAKAGTHDHVPEPLHRVPQWAPPAVCVSSPDEMGPSSSPQNDGKKSEAQSSRLGSSDTSAQPRVLRNRTNITLSSRSLSRREESSDGLNFVLHLGIAHTSAASPSPAILRISEKCPSKGSLSTRKLDLHVAHLAETELRHDRLGRDAVDPRSAKLNSCPKSRPTATIHRPSAAVLTRAQFCASASDNAIVACVLLHQRYTVPSLTTITPPIVDLRDRRHAAQSESEKTSMTCSWSYFHTSFGYLNRDLSIRFFRASPLTRGFDICLHASFDATCKSILSSDKIVCANHDPSVPSAARLVQSWVVSLFVKSVKDLPPLPQAHSIHSIRSHC